MKKKTKQTKSELQKAADRVREIRTAIDKYETIKTGLKARVALASLTLDELNRDLGDTESLLRAQKEKLNRELGSVMDIASTGLVDSVVMCRHE